MGANGSTPLGVQPTALTHEEMRRLQEGTQYSGPEIEQLHRQFMQEAPSGFVPRGEFLALAEVMGVHDATIAGMMFTAFDTNRDGFISFAEFASSMSTMTRGGPDDKTALAFSIYDTGGPGGTPRGYLTKDDLLNHVKSLSSVLGDLVLCRSGEPTTPQGVVDRIFREMNESQDGRLTLREYKAGAHRDPSIVQGLALF